MIENITTKVSKDLEGAERYFVKVKIRNKRHKLTFETISNEQSLAIKSLIEEHQNKQEDSIKDESSDVTIAVLK